MKYHSFEQLAYADLIVDSVYEGGFSGNAGDDPISKLLPSCGNMGGFRIAGKGKKRSFVVLYTSGEDDDWPDKIDKNAKKFIYYGDNKKPGHKLHETPKKGNSLLKEVFETLHSSSAPIDNIPLFFFSKNIQPREAHGRFNSKVWPYPVTID